MLLIVEDNKLLLFYYQALLKDFDIDYHVSSCGLDALDIYRKKNITLVLMDMIVHEMDGYEISRRIRQIEQEKKLSPVPIISVSADEKPTDGKEKNCGISGWIRKPLTKEKLEALIRRFELKNGSK